MYSEAKQSEPCRLFTLTYRTKKRINPDQVYNMSEPLIKWGELMAVGSAMNRRQWLQAAGLVGVGLAAPSIVLRPRAASGQKALRRVSRTQPLMGTLVSITVLDPSEEKAREARDRAFSAMEDLLPIFNRHDSSSFISGLNQNEVLRDVPPELNRVLEQSRVLYRLSDKAFDITILPLLEMCSRTHTGSGYPEWSAVQEKLALTGWDKISRSASQIRLRPGTQITLDGIAKGYIVDRAAETLRAHGVAGALINAGGDIRAVGGKQGSPWQIGVRDPEGQERPVQTVMLRDLAVATSGSYERFFDPSGRHHHLIDRARGDSPRRTVSSTVIAPSAMLADGLSTSFFILQPERSLKLAEKLKHIEAHIITRGGRSFSSSGWKRISA